MSLPGFWNFIVEKSNINNSGLKVLLKSWEKRRNSEQTKDSFFGWFYVSKSTVGWYVAHRPA